MQGGFTSVVIPFVCIILVIFLTYFGTRLLTEKYKSLSSGRRIKVLERVVLGQDKSLVLVMFNQKAYLLGVTGKEIEKLCVLDENELVEDEKKPENSFYSYFMNNLKEASFFPIMKNKKDDGDKNK